MPSILETLQKLSQTLEKLRIDYMFIGGYALPEYGLFRGTVDIDIAIGPSELSNLSQGFERAGFQVSSCSEGTPCFVLTDTKNVTEIEVWTKPDGIIIDQECLRRRRKRQIFGTDFWIIGPEHFIVNKLARKDRRAQDEEDVLSVLMNSDLKLDVPFLHRLAKQANIFPTLKALENKAKPSMTRHRQSNGARN